MSIATPIVRALVEVVERAGVPREEFLHRAGVSDERLRDGLGRFALDEFERIQLLALDLTNDEALGLHVAESASEASFDLLGHLIAHAPTLREAVGLCTRFGGILLSDARIVLEEEVDAARIRHEFRGTGLRANRMHAEFTVAGLCRLMRTFAGPTAPVIAAYFEHAAPEHRPEYRRSFGEAARFNQSFTGIEFSRAFLDSSSLYQHPRLYSLLREEAHRALETLDRGSSKADDVKRYLAARPPRHIPTMDVAARELGMSARSLRRRLALDGVSYRQLVQATLAEAATEMLRTRGHSVQEAAYATGFSDAAAFHRAFKQWTGVTPTEFLRRASSH